MQVLENYERYKYVVENIKDIVWELDANLVFTFVSPTSKETTGYNSNELVGKCMLEFLAQESKELIQTQFEHNRISRVNDESKKIILYDVQFKCKDGEFIWFEASVKPIIKEKNVAGYIGVSRDISEKKECENELRRYIEELKYTNNKLDEMATYDMLTGVYNRRKLDHYVNLSIDKKEKYESPFSIIMFDIDNFKGVNDTFGHKIGDMILQKISSIVKYTIRDTDKLFRWGGEEFLILLAECTMKKAYLVSEKVRKAIESADFDVGDKVTVSLGAGEYSNGESIDQFILRVDNALLKAKANGRNRVEMSLV